MVRDTRAYLWDVQQGCERIARFLLGVDFDAYAANDLVRSAVERQFEIIGEALSQLSKVDADLAAQIPEHTQVIAFRNVLIHGYAALDDRKVWRAAEVSLPKLAIAVDRLLNECGPAPNG